MSRSGQPFPSSTSPHVELRSTVDVVDMPDIDIVSPRPAILSSLIEHRSAAHARHDSGPIIEPVYVDGQSAGITLQSNVMERRSAALETTARDAGVVSVAAGGQSGGIDTAVPRTRFLSPHSRTSCRAHKQ